ncbi:MAG: peptidase domain-containing ABC transporter [Bacteroidales bacterium]|nr:peptidase domain-containing ABC transporter [Bacteroidales bacterium]
MKGLDNRVNIKQHDRQDCGAACLASVCAYYGLRLPLIEFRNRCGIGLDGGTLRGIIDAALSLGMKARAFKAKEADREALEMIEKMPVILHLKTDEGWLHFVVLYGLEGDSANVMDPASGKTEKTSLEQLCRQWTGYLVELSPAESFRPQDRIVPFVRRCIDVLKYVEKEMLFACVASLIATLLSLIQSYFLKELIDSIIPSGERHFLIVGFSVFFLVCVLAVLTGWWRGVMLLKAGLKVDRDLTSSFISKLMTLPVGFFLTRSSGELNSRLSDVRRIRSFVTSRIMLMVVSVLTLAISIGLMAFFSWRLALCCAVFVPVFYLIWNVSDRKTAVANRKLITLGARFEEANVETLSQMLTHKYCSMGTAHFDKLRLQYDNVMSEAFNTGILYTNISSAISLTTKFLTFFYLLAGSLLVIKGHITLGELMAFYSITGFFISPVTALIESNSEINEAKISAQRLFEVIDLRGESYHEGTAAVPESGDLRILDVSFSFPGRELLLDHFNAVFAKGKLSVLCGGNGTGKSTIAHLLLRGYSPREGKILLGDENISSFSLEAWRARAAICTQDPGLFSGTVMENIAPGVEKPDYEALTKAMVLSGIYDMVSRMPEGVMTHIGQRGCMLSGGERQKMAIARALYRNPFLVIFDETPAGMDVEGVAHLEKVIETLKQEGRTVIMISHDRYWMDRADNLVQLKSSAQSIV